MIQRIEEKLLDAIDYCLNQVNSGYPSSEKTLNYCESCESLAKTYKYLHEEGKNHG